MRRRQLISYYDKLEKIYRLAKHQLESIKLVELGYITEEELTRLYPIAIPRAELERRLPFLSEKVWELGNRVVSL